MIRHRPPTPLGGLRPAPGSAPVPESEASPGLGQGVDFGWPEDEVPTKPDNTLNPEILKLVRLLDQMPPVERRRFLSMAEHYGKCGIARRVLIEELARELSAVKEPQ